jgi:hypothetical protein
MEIIFSMRPARFIPLLCALALVGLIALAANIRALSSLALSDSHLTPETQNGRERMEVEIITLRPTGFEPSEITRPKGPFILVVNNQTGINELALKLDSERDRLKDEYLPRGKRRWKSNLDLPAGHYVLSESSDRGRIAHITITPN